jgi:hypothetical protein
VNDWWEGKDTRIRIHSTKWVPCRHQAASVVQPNPEHQAMLEWCGGAFEPRAFDLFDAQQRLDQIKL